ncbi:MAG: hypothetical protein ABI988_02755, partial [Nitrospirota bacterium]
AQEISTDLLTTSHCIRVFLAARIWLLAQAHERCEGKMDWFDMSSKTGTIGLRRIGGFSLPATTQISLVGSIPGARQG